MGGRDAPRLLGRGRSGSGQAERGPRHPVDPLIPLPLPAGLQQTAASPPLLRLPAVVRRVLRETCPLRSVALRSDVLRSLRSQAGSDMPSVGPLHLPAIAEPLSLHFADRFQEREHGTLPSVER